MPSIRGKSYKLITQDIAEGYVSVNPIFLKTFDAETLKGLFNEVFKASAEIRAGKFPHSNALAIRDRNLKLQRLHTASMIIKNFARERGIILI